MKKLIYIFASFIALSTMQAQDRKQPIPGESPAIKINKPVSFTLKNGLKVLVVENHKLPRVSYTLTLDNQPYAEGAKKGVSDLTGALIGSGTKTQNKNSFNEEVDFMGANINFWDSGAYAGGLSKYSKRILEMMADGALNTVFTEEEFQKEKAKLIEGLKTEEKNVPGIARRMQRALTYGKNHPNGEFTTEETLNNISLADIKQNFSQYFVPQNAYLVVTGDVKVDEVKKWITKSFGKWKNVPIAKSIYTEPTDVAKTEINFIDMPNAVQTELAIINLSNLKMTDKDYFAAIVANQILGGDFNSYLNMNLREKHGWTYGARSSMPANKYLSNFSATTQVRNAVADSAIVEALKEVKRIKTELVDETTLKNVKAGYIGKFVMEVEKPQTVANYALRTKTQNLPDDFYENFLKNINAVTAEDIKRVANTYFKDDNFRIVVVSKAADVLPALEKLNIPIKYFDKLGNPTEKPEVKRPVPAGVTAKSVLENYVKTIGGEKALKDVKTVYTVSSATVQGTPLELHIKTADKKLAVEMQAMGMTMLKQVVNENAAYAVQQGKRKDITGEELEQMQDMAGNFKELQLLNSSNTTLSGIENLDGKDAYVIKNGKGNYFYDVNTHLKIAESKEMEQAGQKVTQVTYYDDYKEVKGIKFPHTTIMNVGIEIELKASEIKINEGVTDADFQ